MGLYSTARLLIGGFDAVWNDVLSTGWSRSYKLDVYEISPKSPLTRHPQHLLDKSSRLFKSLTLTLNIYSVKIRRLECLFGIVFGYFTTEGNSWFRRQLGFHRCNCVGRHGHRAMPLTFKPFHTPAMHILLNYCAFFRRQGSLRAPQLKPFSRIDHSD